VKITKEICSNLTIVIPQNLVFLPKKEMREQKNFQLNSLVSHTLAISHALKQAN